MMGAQQPWRAFLPLLALQLALVSVNLSTGAAQRYPYPGTDTVIDVYAETATATLFIRWKGARPSNYRTAFTAEDVNLEFSQDLLDMWTSYRASQMEEANDAMQLIMDALECPQTSGCGFNSPTLNQWVKKNVDVVRGEQVDDMLALPAECNGPLPNSCPAPQAQGRYGPNILNVPAVWNRLPGVDNANPTIRVSVFDTGLRTTHVDFQNSQNLVPGLSVDARRVPPTPLTEDIQGHGTHVSGTVFGLWNGQGMAGIVGRAAGAACNCFTNNTRNPGGVGAPEGNQIACINHAIANNIRIINLSLGGARLRQLPRNDLYRAAFERFCQTGGIAVIAAGNDNIDIGAPNYFYPAHLSVDLANQFPDCILTVGSVNAAGALSDFGRDPATGRLTGSNHGNGVNIAAPGSDILSAGVANDNDFRIASGTSMAAPHIAGVATLLWNAFPTLTGAQVVSCIKRTATRRPTFGPEQAPIPGNIADADAAYNCLQALAPGPTPSPSPSPAPGATRVICTSGHKNSQACLPSSLIGGRPTACTTVNTPFPGRGLLEDGATAEDTVASAASDKEPQTFWSRPTCGVFGDQVCISGNIRSPVTIRVTREVGGATSNVDISVTLRKARKGTRPSCSRA